MSQNFTITFVNIFFQILSFAIVARILLSWIRRPINGSLMQMLIDITQPILDQAKRITPRIGMLDFSPIVALFALDLIRYIILSILTY